RAFGCECRSSVKIRALSFALSQIRAPGGSRLAWRARGRRDGRLPCHPFVDGVRGGQPGFFSRLHVHQVSRTYRLRSGCPEMNEWMQIATDRPCVSPSCQSWWKWSMTAWELRPRKPRAQRQSEIVGLEIVRHGEEPALGELVPVRLIVVHPVGRVAHSSLEKQVESVLRHAPVGDHEAQGACGRKLGC